MAERKLRLAVPIGYPVRANRFNVKDILRLAGIGKYVVKDGRYRNFIPNPEMGIEVVVKKPRDIPVHLAKGFSDLGITGRDWVEEISRSSFREYKPKLSPEIISKIRDLRKLKKLISMINFDNFMNHKSQRFKLDELVDMGCSYVDFAFMTTPKNWEEAQMLKEEINGEGLALLVYYLTRPSRNRTIRCYSEYPKTAHKLLVSAKMFNIYAPFDFKVFRSHAKTERCIKSGEADIIFETYATGEQARESRLSIVEVVPGFSSTARLYARKDFKEFDPNLRLKTEEVQGRIWDVVRDIDNYCQIRIVLDSLYLSTTRIHKLEKELFGEHDLGKAMSISYRHFFSYPYSVYYVDRVIDKKDLPKIETYLRKYWRKGIPSEYANMSREIFEAYANAAPGDFLRIREDANKKFEEEFERFMNGKSTPEEIIESSNKGRVFLHGAVSLDLKSLYAYCPPFFEEYESISDPCRGDKPPYIMNQALQQGEYPCCDISKLRKEHQEQAIIPISGRKIWQRSGLPVFI